MRRFSPLVIGLLLGFLFSLVLNVSSLELWIRGDLTLEHLGLQRYSADEVYYFALLRDFQDGHWQMGNASFQEYADAPSIAGYALLPQGLLLRLGVPLESVILFGDVFCPILLTSLLFLVAFSLTSSSILGSFFALSTMFYWNVSWLRTMNPQVTIPIFTFALLMFVRDRTCRHPWIRGFFLAVVALSQPLFALYIAAMELWDGLLSCWRSSPLLVLRQRWPIVLFPLGIVVLFSYLFLHADTSILADTSFRRGLISSHLPAAPFLQGLVLLSLCLWSCKLRRSIFSDTEGRMVLVLLLASFTVLNQSIVHGKDVVFGLYYRLPVDLVVSLSIFLWIRRFLSQWCVYLALAVVFIFSLRLFAQEIDYSRQPPSDLDDLMSAIDALPGQRVVLASLEVSNVVPVFTRQHSFFTTYAHYEYAPDQVLAERYLVQGLFFPYAANDILEGYPLVFGIGAGNLYARHKILCRLQDFFGVASHTCSTTRLSDFILHQHVRLFIEKGEVDTMLILQKAGVDTVVIEHDFPSVLKEVCTFVKKIHQYSLYDCDFGL